MHKTYIHTLYNIHIGNVYHCFYNDDNMVGWVEGITILSVYCIRKTIYDRKDIW